MDDKLRSDLVRDECLHGKPALESYLDSQGFWTIGIGHLLGSVRRMTTITLRECDALYLADVADATDTLHRACPFTRDDDWGLREPARLRALINMAFNRGGHMIDSTTITPAIITAAVSHNWTPVGSAIEKSQWASQVGARALRLRDALLAGGA